MADNAATDGLFAFDEATYAIYEPMLRRDFQPRSLIQFRVVLPFQIPIGDGMLTLVNQDDTAINCHFQVTETPEVVFSGEPIADQRFYTLSRYRTQVDMTLITAELIELKSVGNEDFNSRMVSRYFDACLGGLNTFLRASLVEIGDSDIYRVSRPMLQSTSFYRVVPLRDWSQAVTSLFVLHFDVPYQKEIGPIEVTRNIAELAKAIRFKLNPFMLSQEIALNASRQYNKGFYQEAVIFANLSVETFLSHLHTELLIELEGKLEADAAMLTSNITFNTLIKSGFKDRLGGRWDVTDQSTDIGRWWNSTYQLRNDVVHRGYFPLQEEAKAALDAAFKFRDYVASLIKRKKKKLPKTFTYFRS